MDLAGRAGGDIDVAGGVGGETACGERSGDGLPGFVGQQDLHDGLRRGGRGADGSGIVAPEPAQGVGQDRRALLAAVPLRADDELHIVAGEAQRRRDILIADIPVAGVDVLIGGAVLHKDAQRARLVFADVGGEGVAAAQVGEAADVTDDAVELIGARPGGDEGGDAAGTRAAERRGRRGSGRD